MWGLERETHRKHHKFAPQIDSRPAGFESGGARNTNQNHLPWNQTLRRADGTLWNQNRLSGRRVFLQSNLPRRNSETSPPFLFSRTTPPERRSPGAHAGPDHLQEDFAALASLRLRGRDPFRTHIPGRESASQRVKPVSGASPFGTPLLGPKSGPRMGARKQGAGRVHEGEACSTMGPVAAAVLWGRDSSLPARSLCVCVRTVKRVKGTRGPVRTKA